MDGGVNMAKCSTVNYSLICSHSGRIDAEYYKTESLQAYDYVKESKFKLLGQLIKEGYRVVYENTNILRPDKVDEQRDVRFLQATNVSEDGLWVEVRDIGFVSGKDWQKYPKGRIKHGELLIEVKGQAEKVTIVQDYIPMRTLVTGTLYKLIVNENIVSPEYIYAYFSCKYGKILRDRTKVNTLISYVSKPELYNIPVPIFEDHIDEITNLIKESYRHSIYSHHLYNQAEALLAYELQLDKLKLPCKKWYSANYSEVLESKRLDPSHYRDAYSVLFEFLNSRFICKKIGEIVIVNRRGLQPIYSDKGNVMVVNSKHLSQTHINYDQTEKTTIEEFSKQSVAQIKDGDVLIYTTGAYIGLTNAFNSQEKALASNHVNILRLSDNTIDPNYLALVLNSVVGKLQTEKHSRGSAQLELYPADIAKFFIPVIDEGLMRKIGELVRKSLASLNQSKQLLAQAKYRVEELIEQEANK